MNFLDILGYNNKPENTIESFLVEDEFDPNIYVFVYNEKEFTFRTASEKSAIRKMNKKLLERCDYDYYTWVPTGKPNRFIGLLDAVNKNI